MSRNNSNLDCKVYVGDLGYGAAKQELEDVFSRYGPLRNVWIARNPPGFAFVEFEDPRDVPDACRGLDGTKINGRRVRVEASSGKSRWNSGGGPPRRGGRGGGGGDMRRSGGSYRRDSDPYKRSRSRSPRRRSPSPRRTHTRSRSPVMKRSSASASKSPEKRSSGRREWD